MLANSLGYTEKKYVCMYPVEGGKSRRGNEREKKIAWAELEPSTNCKGKQPGNVVLCLLMQFFNIFNSYLPPIHPLTHPPTYLPTYLPTVDSEDCIIVKTV